MLVWLIIRFKNCPKGTRTSFLVGGVEGVHAKAKHRKDNKYAIRIMKYAFFGGMSMTAELAEDLTAAMAMAMTMASGGVDERDYRRFLYMKFLSKRPSLIYVDLLFALLVIHYDEEIFNFSSENVEGDRFWIPGIRATKY